MKTSTLNLTLFIILVIWMLAAPMLTGCGDETLSGSNADSVENALRGQMDRAGVSMDEIKASVVEILGENYWPDKQLTRKELEVQTGITADMYEEFLAEKQNVETDIDTMIILKTGEEELSAIETKLNDYRDALMVKYKDRPQELGKVKASRIEIIDSYICYVQLGADTGAAAKKGDEEVIVLCQQENERALDVIEKTIFDALIHSGL